MAVMQRSQCGQVTRHEAGFTFAHRFGRHHKMNLFKKIFARNEPQPIPNLGRNDPCWCGSGKKYKRCHMEIDEKKRSKFRASTCTIASWRKWWDEVHPIAFHEISEIRDTPLFSLERRDGQEGKGEVSLIILIILIIPIPRFTTQWRGFLRTVWGTFFTL